MRRADLARPQWRRTLARAGTDLLRRAAQRAPPVPRGCSDTRDLPDGTQGRHPGGTAQARAGYHRLLAAVLLPRGTPAGDSHRCGLSVQAPASGGGVRPPRLRRGCSGRPAEARDQDHQGKGPPRHRWPLQVAAPPQLHRRGVRLERELRRGAHRWRGRRRRRGGRHREGPPDQPLDRRLRAWVGRHHVCARGRGVGWPGEEAKGQVRRPARVRGVAQGLLGRAGVRPEEERLIR
mmetsp:Transcript_18161/g.43162  ORF Transcript_18161/g.43162 Transcript_18161/m.43162 type:complete len:235 (-) Transcript_18161:107-811(-)